MKPFIAVIGSANSGKSTVIKSLTGCKNGTFRGVIHDNLTGKQVFVCAASPQEMKISDAQRRGDRRDVPCQSGRKRNVLLCIRPNNLNLIEPTTICWT